MSLAKGVLGSVIGGAVGAAIWTGLSYATGWQFSILAIIVGGLAGMGMGIGNGGRGGRQAGVLAAVVAFFAVLGGKFAVTHLLVSDWIESQEVTMDDARSHLADEVYNEFEAAGTAMTGAEDDDSYPPQVEREAERRWHRMSSADQEDYRRNLERQRREDSGQAAGVLTVIAFIFSFGIFGLVCLFLAVSTAYKTGSHVIEKSGEEMVNTLGVRGDDDLPAGHGYFNRLGAGEGQEQPAPAVAATPPSAPARPAKPAAPAEEEPSGYAFFNSLGRNHNEQGDPVAAPRPGTARPDTGTDRLRDAA